jgi:hypothetical protein
MYLVVVGLAFGVRGVISFQDPDYWEPVTVLDYASIWTYSLALVLAGPALMILVPVRPGPARGRPHSPGSWLWLPS